MGLISSVLLFPVTGPVAGIRWTLGKIQRVVQEELVDDSSVKQELMELQVLLELGDSDDDEDRGREAVLMQRLRDVRRWREEFGLSAPGGPVRVVRRPAEDDLGEE